MERRKHQRLTFSAPAFLEKDTRVFFGQVKDISQQGMFLAVHGDHRSEEDAAVSIYFISGPITLSVTVPGRVVRSGSDGVGFSSPHLDPYLLMTCESLMKHEGEAPERFMADFYEFISTPPPAAVLS
ncbi:hypothetical protein GURASL_35180 [Geotalea uraniireducens]|uniref:PilZ domain-containing protein n=1 Tax=Geotalea uraniireducens TaxID=351604 RepID=A0ABM8EQ52_9BACT|nr:PilZ domain-containing protein [Geotalea uraniireducens]BDV44595.1 hypothetical protein GURASL_35180 [Geotalea uraniireducens]